MTKVLQIRGGHGSGKSSFAKDCIRFYGLKTKEIPIGNKKYLFYGNEDNSFLIIGKYNTSCGGCDGYIKNAEELLFLITEIVSKVKPEIFIFEGVVFGKTLSLAQKINDICKKYNSEYIPIFLMCGLEKSIERILERNNGKPFNPATIYKVYRGALLSVKNLRDNNIFCKVINTEKIQKEEYHKIIEGLWKQKK